MDFKEFFTRENVTLAARKAQLPFDGLFDSQTESQVQENFQKLIMANKNMFKHVINMSEGMEMVKFKLLQFYEDVRPPYFGMFLFVRIQIDNHRIME